MANDWAELSLTAHRRLTILPDGLAKFRLTWQLIDPKINLRISSQTDLELLCLASELT